MMRGNGRVFQRGNRLWIAYYAPKGGKSIEIRESGGKTEAEARRLLRQRLREIAVHKEGLRPFQGPRHERITVEELPQGLERDYKIHGRKSLPELRAHLRAIRSYFSLDRTLAVTSDRIRDYIVHRQEQGAAPATINRELAALRRAFNLAVEAGTIAQAPKFTSLPEHNIRQGFFERWEFEPAKEFLPPHLQDFARFGYLTGWRKGEIRSLTWADVDRSSCAIHLRSEASKNGKGRLLAMDDELWSIIERRWLSRHIGDRLIPFVFHRDGKQITSFRKAWAAACKKAGLTGKLFHDLRRTAVRNMRRGGVEERIAMTISGHQTRSVFDRYNIVSEDDVREAMGKVTAYVASLPSTPTVIPLPQRSQ
jgi:integrase